MNSTDNLLNDPFKKIELDLPSMVSQFKNPSVIPISRNTYNAMKEHDLAIYVMTEYPYEVYYGDSLIHKGMEEEVDRKVKYYMSYDPEKREYVIYMSEPGKMYIYPLLSEMTEVERYKDPQSCIDALKRYTLRGFSGSVPNSIYTAITSYRLSNLTLNQSIMSIISILGYGETAEFQMLIETGTIYNLNNEKYKTKLPKEFLALLQPLDDQSPNVLYKLYNGVYGIFLKYGFFQDKKYNPDITDEIDLSDPIRDIMSLFLFGTK